MKILKELQKKKMSEMASQYPSTLEGHKDFMDEVITEIRKTLIQHKKDIYYKKKMGKDLWPFIEKHFEKMDSILEKKYNRTNKFK